MEKTVTGKTIQFDLEGQNSNNCSSESDISKGHWTELLLESGGGEDSGHFTATPETDNSGSSRGHSPQAFPECPAPPPTSAVLVQQVGREAKTLVEGDGDQAVPSSVLPHSNLNGPSISVLKQSAKVNAKSIGGIFGKMPTSGEGDDGSHSSGYLRDVVENFNALYKEKLRMIEEAGKQGDVYTKQIVMEKKANILESWAKDVCVQNIVLIHTVEELEKQADDKLSLLQKKIQESTNLAKQHVLVIQKYESQAKSLMKDKETSKEAQKELKRELDNLKSEYKRIRERIKDLEKDNDSLVTLINRIRDMGVWDIAGLELHKRTFEQIFGLYPNLPGSEVQTVFTRDKARRIQETEEKVIQLEREVSELTSLKNDSDLTVYTKESKLVELENEFKMVSQKLQHCQDECEHYKKSLIDTQEKLLEATKELQVRSSKTSRATTPNAADAARHAEIQELLQELRIVKAQLNASVNESQSAKIETSMIRKEFNERLKSMQESQQCYQTELTHSLESHNQIQEKEAQLLKVNEQVRSYQSKCEAAEQLLGKKDDMIEELQQQVKQLNKKEMFMSSEVFLDACAKSKVYNADSANLKCGRDHLHQMQNQIKSSPGPVIIGSRNQKPPWNDHFVKGSSLVHHSNERSLKSTKNNLANNEKIRNKEICNSNVMSSDSVGFMSHTKESSNLHQSNFNAKSSFSCSCGSYDVHNASIMSSEIKSADQKQKLEACLPKIKDKFDLKAEIQKLQDLKSQGWRGSEKFPQLPEINPKRSNGTSLVSKDLPSFPKIDNPLAHASTYGLLMDIAVKASKDMMASTDERNPNNQVSSVRVMAGHSNKRNQLQSHVHVTKTENRNPDLNQKQNQGKSKTGHHDKTRRAQDVHSTEKPLEVKFDNEAPTNSKISLSLEDLLAELPEQSFMSVVQDWMNKSSFSLSSKLERSKVSRPKIPVVRNPKYNVSKQLSGRKTPPKTSGKSSSSVMFTAKKKLFKDISDIKEEWNRVFENLDENISRNDADSRMKDTSTSSEVSEDMEDYRPDSVSYGSQHTFEEKYSHSLTNTYPQKPKATTVPIHTVPESTMEKTILEKLKKEFQDEKAKREEEFQKELKDKDIEITMQKVTIQHLQGALVALKRGQPIPVPQSSIGKANGNGNVSVSNGGKGQNGNSRTSEALFGNGLLKPGENTTSVFGSGCLWELMNSFEELKTKSLQQLEDLKNGNNLLTAKSVCMEKKISLFRHLMFIQDIRTNINSFSLEKATKSIISSASAKDADIISNGLARDDTETTITTAEITISTKLANELKEIKKHCRIMIHQCSVEAENVKLLTKVDDTLKTEIAEVQWQLERFKALAAELEDELVARNEEIILLKHENEHLKKKNSKVEEDLWTAKIEVLDLKNEHESENSGYFSPLKRLEAMKKAFYRNEEIIQRQKLEIEDRNILISKYAQYCCLYETFDERNRNSKYLKADIGKSSNVSDNLGTLPGQEIHREKWESCNSQGKNQESAPKSDDGFMDTVKSLTDHIEELMEHNETFMKQMPDNLENELSSQSRPEYLTPEKKKISMDLSQGCGDVMNDIIVNHFEIERSRPSNPNPTSQPSINECHSNLLFEDLTRMAKSAERLGLSSQDIISASFSLLGIKAVADPQPYLHQFHTN